MKKLVLFIGLLTSISIISCDSSKKSEEIASYTYKEKKVEMSDSLKAKIPEWVEVGKICYGLVIQITKNDKLVKGKPVKAKVVQIDENSVKMKAIETVILNETIDCSLRGINKGQVWDEKEGDLYLSIDEAIEALEKMNIYQQDN